ncbi:Cof-type HAD-IIB family hydrolase [Shouchella clausii]|uniref:Cof-type HAD-IIB family hydrolase n=1 Tax=Shouchella clausii TaxID=79880 RepID=UPI000B97BC5F|nr:Cof-type HAD-IIB family hydrolase [Shouchella clausii]AST97681.1 phosphoglycolate phosphatase [Shouchella clausii]MBU8595022.1 Cof-type HAD-IIB family hydrolase [Shouchella clausii]MCR1290202.1 Cof-type HAD-IIB family hydrolase [Shouchella clausii]MCY1106877.1 Cof-type HAD-IIB family hydrolase [Shouchella clausii]MEB5475078.1 Cof-type HAD-IIB family hydrolase [Shouchella clausii]
MSDIKMIALDMDGTLLNDNKEITSWTKNQIRKAQHAGITVVLCTGRPFSHCHTYIQDLQLHSHSITCNGGQIYAVDHSVMTEHLFDPATLANLYHFAQGLEMNTWTISTKEAYYNDLPENCSECQWLKFSCSHKDEDILNKIAEKVQSIDGVEISNRTAFTVEVNPTGVNKAAALEWVCEKLGITMKHVMAIGDSLNDIKMIQSAGIGIAMGNAQKAVQQVADAITDTNNNDGVGKAIEKFILGGNV